MTRFDALDQVPAPDQWQEILDRSEAALPGPIARAARARVAWWLAAAAILVVALIAATALALGDRKAPVSDGTDRSVVTTEDEPLLTCPDGSLLAGTVPPDAESKPSASGEIATARSLAFSWSHDGMGVELLVPGIPYIDFVGERTEEVAEPRGLLYFPQGSSETRFISWSGLGTSCGGYELTATGRDEAARRRLVLDLAEGMRWASAHPATTDCGPMARAVETRTGRSLEEAFAAGPAPWTVLGDLRLEPKLGTVLRSSGGRCSVLVTTTEGLPLRLEVSGSDGEFGIASVSSLSQRPVSLTVRPEGRQVVVHLDYWCGGCTQATVAVDVLGRELSGTVTVGGNTEARVDLPQAPGQGMFEVELRYYAGAELRDVVTAVYKYTLPS